MASPSLVPALMVVAVIAFGFAAATAGAAAAVPRCWEAAVALVVLGGITPLIQAVSIRVMPVFARRSWRSPRLLAAQAALTVAGGWLVWAGRIGSWQAVERVGAVAALMGGLLMMLNVARLMRQPAAASMIPGAGPAQIEADRTGRRFTRMAGGYLLLGLAVGAVTAWWRPAVGRWDLVWAHSLLVGFFLSMAAGVSYHVLPRWTGQPWRHTGSLAAHFWLVAAGLPVMILSLALGSGLLFAAAGVLQAMAGILFIVNIAPQVPVLPEPTRAGYALAATALAAGLALGGWFAVDPAAGALLRQAHATINLFGFAGLLTAGSAYYLAPRFAGKPLRWPTAALGSVAAIAAGTLVSAVGWGGFMASGWAPWPVEAGSLVLAAGFAVESAILGATAFLPPAGRSVQPLTLRGRPVAPTRS